MYCVVIEEQMKQQPPPSMVFRNPRWERVAPGSASYELTGEAIERAPKTKWRVVLKESMRVDGKLAKRQWYLRTITYWDIVDYPGNLSSFFLGAIEKHFPYRVEPALRLVEEKFSPIWEAVTKEYRKSEEYKWFVENRRMREKENPNFKEKTKKKKRSTNAERPISGLMFTDAEMVMADRVIRAGYRKLATDCHPDRGGSHSEMVALNLVKEKLESLIEQQCSGWV